MRCDLLLVIPSVVSRTATPQQNARDSLKGLQRYKRGKSVDRISGSAGCRVAHASRVLAKPSRFRGLLKIVSARRRNQNARRVRYPEFNPRVSQCNLFNESRTLHIVPCNPSALG